MPSLSNPFRDQMWSFYLFICKLLCAQCPEQINYSFCMSVYLEVIFLSVFLLLMYHHKVILGKHWKCYYNLDNNFTENSSSKVFCYYLKLLFYIRKSDGLKQNKTTLHIVSVCPSFFWLLRHRWCEIIYASLPKISKISVDI